MANKKGPSPRYSAQGPNGSCDNVTSYSADVKALKRVREESGLRLYQFSGHLQALPDGAIIHRSGLSALELEHLLEAGFPGVVALALEMVPGEVVRWIMDRFAQERGREFRVNGLHARRGAVYAG